MVIPEYIRRKEMAIDDYHAYGNQLAAKKPARFGPGARGKVAAGAGARGTKTQRRETEAD